MRKRSLLVLSIVWMLILVAGVSSAITMAFCGVFSSDTTQSGGKTLVTSEDYRTIERYSRLEAVRKELEAHYYVELPEDELVLGAVRGMLEAVQDPYTFYYTKEEMASLAEHTQGLYEGVGLMLSTDKDGQLVVLRVFAGSPAQDAGICVGDRITAVNNEAVDGHTSKALTEAVSKIKAAEGPLVSLTIHRGNETINIGMTRASVAIQRVEYDVLPGDIGYIVIYEFIGDDVTGFERAVEALRAQNVCGLILDLRSNPGGLLADVVNIADALLPKGLIVYTQDRSGRREEYYADSDYWDVPMVVLVNGMSASASEILAGAVQDRKRGLVVGENTFGKGIVQTLVPFRSDGAGMQLTTAAYFTPTGRSIHGLGIQPDLLVELDESANVDTGTVSLSADNQLNAAYLALQKQRKGE